MTAVGCGCCGRRDPEWVKCDACSLWYHQLCEKAPPGCFNKYFIFCKCQTKILTRNLYYISPLSNIMYNIRLLQNCRDYIMKLVCEDL